jgi:hypothetical protein
VCPRRRAEDGSGNHWEDAVLTDTMHTLSIQRSYQLALDAGRTMKPHSRQNGGNATIANSDSLVAQALYPRKVTLLARLKSFSHGGPS